MPPPNPVNVFFCYAPEDEDLRAELEKHLALLSRQGYVRGWSSRRLGAGAEWRGEIDRRLDEADAVLLLVSADFLASDYLFDVELRRALERHRTEGTKVISIILRPCDYRYKGSPLAEVEEVLPREADGAKPRPVTEWSSRDAAFTNVAEKLRRIFAGTEAISLNPPPAHLPNAPGR
jgi:TIR domain